MRLRRAGAGLAVAVGLGVLPLGCGAAGDGYCAALRADQTLFAEDAGGAALVEELPRLRALGAQAPTDLADEWQVFLAALSTLKDALDQAGVSPQQFVDGKTPAGLSPGQRADIADAASGLTREEVLSAAEGITQQAADVCKLQLGL